MKKLTVCILFWIACFCANGTTFPITSNADSGPGTLREAITLAAANGTGTQDIITFSLPDVSRAGRTITVLSELPELTSNLVIDGTTQTGAAFGVSNARVIINIRPSSQTTLTFLRFTGAMDIEIYGLFLFYDIFDMFNTGASTISGIEFYGGRHIQIGKPGKGNYFRGLKRAIYSPITAANALQPNSSDVTIQGNIFGNDETGAPGSNYGNSTVNPVEMAIQIYNCSNVLVGGSAAGESNVITAYEVNIQSRLATGNGYLKFLKNYVGVLPSGALPSSGPAGNTKVYFTGGYRGYNAAVSDYELEIKDNVISGAVHIYGLTKWFTVQGNQFIFDNTNSFGQADPKLNVMYCTPGGIIGGNASGLPNDFYSLRCNLIFANSTISQGSIFTSSSVVIQQNRMKNNAPSGSSIQAYSLAPVARIDSTGINVVRGKATPGSKIEVFLDDACLGCDGEILLGETTSAADSSWSFSGTFSGTVIATATKNNSTSGYTEPLLNAQFTKIQQPTCGQANGSIKGIFPFGSFTRMEWHHEYRLGNQFFDSLVTTDADLVNVPPGSYYLIAKLGATCQSGAIRITLRDMTPKIDSAAQQIKQPACGSANGSLSGFLIRNSEYTKAHWRSDNGTIYPVQYPGSFISLNNLPPGRYQLIATDTLYGCADSSHFYTLINQSGPELRTNNMLIVPATCENSDGSIRGITAVNQSGIATIRWVDSLNRVVGINLDLSGVPAGKYRLKFKDAASCDTITTQYYIVGKKGEILIDTTNRVIAAAKCTGATGSIRGLRVTGGATYAWRNSATGAVVATTLDVQGLPAGSYQLTVSNNAGCIKTSSVMVILQASFLPISVRAWGSIAANCGKANGRIDVQTYSRDTALYTFRWIDSARGTAVVGWARGLTDIRGGTYLLFARDSNGCEQQIFRLSIVDLPMPSIDYSTMSISPDQCLSSVGAINGMTVKDMHGGRGDYVWYNSSGDSIGRELNIAGLSPDSYQLKATDLIGCSVVSTPVVVGNWNITLASPLYDEPTILKNTTATLKVKIFRDGNYTFFDGPLTATPLQVNTTGTFTTGLLTQDQTFYVQYSKGVCSSDRVPVKVKVVDKTAVYVPDAFTPNRDGKNDLLKAVPFGLVKLHHFTVFNRWGGIVFSTSNFVKGWDGTINGQPVDTGVYVWVLQAVDEMTGKIIEQKGSVVLIR